MIKKQILILSLLASLMFACSYENSKTKEKSNVAAWSVKHLEQRAHANLEESKWNQTLFKQDIETHAKYAEIFKQYPLNNYPFQVADYDYAVYSNPFVLNQVNTF